MKHPYKKGYLAVGEGHKLYYELCGNKKGLPVLFLHGGPGAGFNENHKKLFDFKKFNVIFLDQRGAGRSKPFAGIKTNKTSNLVKDISKILDYLNIKRVFLFGGSWGSTLALVYAIRNPKRVIGMFLRGIFLATREENRFYTHDVKNFFPAEYERMISLVPESRRNDVLRYYCRQMMGNDKKKRGKYAYEWSLYEHSILKLVPDKNPGKSIKKFPCLSLGVLETYYLSNGCFIPEGYILKNAKKLKMPVSIAQGRYDLICPPVNAWKLHRMLPNSRIHFAISGHSGSDPETKKITKKEMSRFERILRKF